VNNIAVNLRSVRERIEAAAVKVGRDPGEVKVIAVSKSHPADALRQAINAGCGLLGENKVQEAEGKIAELGRKAAEWHLIGHLQSNKARKAVQLFDVIHTVDSVEIAERLDRICGEAGRDSLRILVQVDIAGEETKSGIAEDDLTVLSDFLQTCRHLKFEGLMIIPPYFADPEATRPFFKRIREIRDNVIPGGALSMGMSHDFEVAVEEGATIVRVGTAIFGQREYGAGR
jgi:PLP dependent protein